MEAIESFAKFNIPFIEEEDTSPHDVRSPNGSRWPQPVFRRDSSADEKSDSDGSNSVSNPTKFDVKPSNYLNPIAKLKEDATCEQLRFVSCELSEGRCRLDTSKALKQPRYAKNSYRSSLGFILKNPATYMDTCILINWILSGKFACVPSNLA